MRKLAIVMIAALGLAGCESGPTGRQVGAAGGAIAGILIGSQIGSGVGRAAAIVGLAVLGGWLGGELGEELSRDDKALAGRATEDALENNDAGEAQAWSNPDTGSSGSVTPGPTYTPRSGGYSGRDCREIDVVVTPGGEDTKRGKRTACRKENGDWEVVSA